MNPPNEPFREPPLPAQGEYRRFNVLQERTLSEFKIFGESLSQVREDVSGMKVELREVKEDIAVLKVAAKTHTDAIKANTGAIQLMRLILKGSTIIQT